MLVSTLACTPSDTTQSHAAKILQQVQDLQRLQDAEAEDIGGEFGDLNPADSKCMFPFNVTCGGDELWLSCSSEKQQKAKILLWSAKSALFKAAVDLQAETQPLRASKDRGKRIGT
jgi:hypothetical protein